MGVTKIGGVYFSNLYKKSRMIMMRKELMAILIMRTMKKTKDLPPLFILFLTPCEYPL